MQIQKILSLPPVKLLINAEYNLSDESIEIESIEVIEFFEGTDRPKFMSTNIGAAFIECIPGLNELLIDLDWREEIQREKDELMESGDLARFGSSCLMRLYGPENQSLVQRAQRITARDVLDTVGKITGDFKQVKNL